MAKDLKVERHFIAPDSEMGQKALDLCHSLVRLTDLLLVPTADSEASVSSREVSEAPPRAAADIVAIVKPLFESWELGTLAVVTEAIPRPETKAKKMKAKCCTAQNTSTGEKVQVTDDYRDYGDAGGGPLQLGNIGIVCSNSGGKLKVRYNDREWWYDSRALQKYEPEPRPVKREAAPIVEASAEAKPKIDALQQFVAIVADAAVTALGTNNGAMISKGSVQFLVPLVQKLPFLPPAVLSECSNSFAVLSKVAAALKTLGPAGRIELTNIAAVAVCHSTGQLLLGHIQLV